MKRLRDCAVGDTVIVKNDWRPEPSEAAVTRVGRLNLYVGTKYNEMTFDRERGYLKGGHSGARAYTPDEWADQEARHAARVRLNKLRCQINGVMEYDAATLNAVADLLESH